MSRHVSLILALATDIPLSACLPGFFHGGPVIRREGVRDSYIAAGGAVGAIRHHPGKEGGLPDSRKGAPEGHRS